MWKLKREQQKQKQRLEWSKLVFRNLREKKKKKYHEGAKNASVFGMKAKLCLYVVEQPLNNYVNVATMCTASQAGLPNRFGWFFFFVHTALHDRRMFSARSTHVRVWLWVSNVVTKPAHCGLRVEKKNKKKICTPSASPYIHRVLLNAIMQSAFWCKKPNTTCTPPTACQISHATPAPYSPHHTGPSLGLTRLN